MDPSSGAARWFVIAFSSFFCAVSLSVLGVGLYHRDVAEIGTSVLMLAAGGLFLSSAVVGVRAVPGHSIGGAPLMARVFLEPDEAIIEQGAGGYDFSSKRTAGMSWSNLLGHTVVTDRRILFLPYFYSLRPIPKSIAFSDIDHVSDGRNAPFIGPSFVRSLALNTTTDTAHNVWSSAKVIDAIVQRASHPSHIATAPLRYDAGFPRLVQFAAAVTVFGMFGAFLLKPEPPFLRWYGGITVFLLGCLALPLVTAAWSYLRRPAAKRA